jgi:hypothetical protein
MSRKPKAKTRKKPEIYTDGDLNKIIDAIFHPLAKKDANYMALDTFFHAIVEHNPSITIHKFIKYNLPKILDEFEKSKKDSSA